MRLRFEHPHLANLPCSECQLWVHDLKTGKPQLYGGQKLKQHPSGPPCVQDPGSCPKGGIGKSDLTYQNERVVRHFEMCRAVGQFPDDDIVKRHASILGPIYDQHEERHNQDLLATKIARILLPRVAQNRRK